MKHSKKVFKITMAALTIVCTFIFTPWQILWTWITPLPKSIQEQLNEATDLGFDGIIVYVDQHGKPPAFMLADGWIKRIK